MNKIVIRGQFPIQVGKQTQGREAAKALRERVLREDPGVLIYEFFLDESQETVAMVEAYADEPSLLQHIDASDFTQLFATLDFASAKLQIHGNLSDALHEKLVSIAGPFEHFLPLDAQ